MREHEKKGKPRHIIIYKVRWRCEGCLAWHVNRNTEARKLRAYDRFQRRMRKGYFYQCTNAKCGRYTPKWLAEYDLEMGERDEEGQ